MGDADRFPGLELLGKHDFGLTMHDLAREVTEQRQGADDDPGRIAVHDPPAPTVSHAEAQPLLHELHNRRISTQVALRLPRLRPSTKAKPMTTSTPATAA